MVLKNTKIEELNFIEVEQHTKIPFQEINFLFRLTEVYIRLCTGASNVGNSLQFKSINLGNGNDVFYNYKEFPGIVKIILFKTPEENYQEEEKFNTDEMIILNKKLDNLTKELAELKQCQEIFFEDVMNELDELKNLYNLSKKTWHQLFLGKLGEMVMSGVISETISKKIVEIIITPVTNLFL